MKTGKLTEFTKKLHMLEDLKSKYIANKYNLLCHIFIIIGKKINVDIRILTNFKKIEKTVLEQHTKYITELIRNNKSDIEKVFDKKIKVPENDLSKILSFFRSLLRDIDYNIYVRKDYVYIHKIKVS